MVPGPQPKSSSFRPRTQAGQQVGGVGLGAAAAEKLLKIVVVAHGVGGGFRRLVCHVELYLL